MSNHVFSRSNMRKALISPIYLELIMQDYGQGYCDNGYYKGWDGLGDTSAEDCKDLCLNELSCQFAAYYSGPEIISNGRKRTCSRYNEPSCKLLASLNFERRHKTFKRTAPAGWLKATINLLTVKISFFFNFD